MFDVFKRWFGPKCPKVSKQVASLLSDLGDFQRMHRAQDVLLSIGIPVISPLYDKLLRGEPDPHDMVLKTLAYIGTRHPEHVIGQLPVLLTHCDHYKRLHGCSLVRMLIELSPRSAIRTHLVGELALRQVIHAIGNPSVPIKVDCCDFFWDACASAYPEAPVNITPHSPDKRNGAYRAAIGRVRAEAVVQFLPLSQHPNSRLRIRTVQVLGYVDFGTDEVVAAVTCSATQDIDEDVRWNANRSLSYLLTKRERELQRANAMYAAGQKRGHAPVAQVGDEEMTRVALRQALELAEACQSEDGARETLFAIMTLLEREAPFDCLGDMIADDLTDRNGPELFGALISLRAVLKNRLSR